MTFTTRPEIQGTFGVVASTHWIASAVGMSILEKGGNAFDAAAAMGMTLAVVEPHLNGPLGDMPLIFRKADSDRPTVLCAQGVTPARATIEHYRGEGLTLIPDAGLLATVVPGVFDGWMTLLRDHGSLPLREIMEPAIYYAAAGHPVLPRVCQVIAGMADFFRTEWPTSAETWLPGGEPPRPGTLFKNPVLAAAWGRLLDEAEAVSGREAQIEAARNAFYRGFVAEAIDRYLQTAEVMDSAGGRRKGVLTADDMAGWSARYEEPVSTDYHDWTVWKAGFWSQGPSLLQSLAMLEGVDMTSVDPNSADFVHLVTETLKLAMADREAYYGDPDFSDIPADTLLSKAYAADRRGLIGERASHDFQPGTVPGYEAWRDAAIRRAEAGPEAPADISEKRGDTVHLDVIDRWGNMVTATPSGGWLQSSPVVPGLGMALNSRAQMFWLEDGLPTSLGPGRRPRTTLSPSLASFEGRPTMAFGTPGGDQQEQWQLILFLRHVHHIGNLQAAIDAPLFNTAHLQLSFYPRPFKPGHLMVEPAFGEAVIADLRARGHAVEVSDPWAIGRLTAARREADGRLRAAATPRLMQAYAIGR